ncbi:MAG: hypothetical protein VYE22_41730 [Myxococcota bacterium]|nr:hypothetical protein [Myxococcota bacterium]
MLPWETLRRLLGLPPDMSPLGATELVRLAIDDPRRARIVAMGLRGQRPDEAAAGMILAALDRGTLPPELAAELLGAVGHRAAYDILRAMLLDPEMPNAWAAAGVAMAQVLGLDAGPDLAVAMREAPERGAREGAAFGLAELGDEAAVAGIVEAGLRGLIRARVAARCGADLPFLPELWLQLLASSERTARRLGTELIYVLLNRNDPGAQERLEALGPRAKSAVREALEDPSLYMLPEKRATLEAWSAA